MSGRVVANIDLDHLFQLSYLELHGLAGLKICRKGYDDRAPLDEREEHGHGSGREVALETHDGAGTYPRVIEIGTRLLDAFEHGAVAGGLAIPDQRRAGGGAPHRGKDEVDEHQ